MDSQRTIRALELFPADPVVTALDMVRPMRCVAEDKVEFGLAERADFDYPTALRVSRAPVARFLRAYNACSKANFRKTASGFAGRFADKSATWRAQIS